MTARNLTFKNSDVKPIFKPFSLTKNKEKPSLFEEKGISILDSTIAFEAKK